MRRILYALLSVALAAGLIAGVLLTWSGLQEKGKAEAEDHAYEQDEQELEQLGVTIPPDIATTLAEPVATTTVPATTTTAPATTVQSTTSAPTTSTTTTVPATTTTTAPFSPDRNLLAVNAVFGWIETPVLRNGERLTLSRADERDSGHDALEGGGTAWFPSSYAYADGTMPNDLALPGEGGVVAIGGHRGGYSRSGPFANLHLMQAGDIVTVVSVYPEPQGDGTTVQRTMMSRYEVTEPCPEGSEHCVMHVNDLLRTFAEYESDVETLFLFSCDDGTRIFVKAELVSEMWL